MLILCEKPSVAKDFAAFFKAPYKKGYYQAGDTVITYCVGHLYELLPPEGYDPSYKKWSLDSLPITPSSFIYQVNEATSDQADTVMKLLERHKGGDVLIATDAGREGELIARIVLLAAGVTDISRFRRFWVSEALTASVIEEGIKNSKPLSDYNLLAFQGFARQKADWLVGINLTRFMSIGNPPPPFTVGRVQTAVLSSIAGRNHEVKNFVAVPYKKLEASITSKDGVVVKAYLENPRIGKTSFFESDWPYLYEAMENCRNSIFGLDSVDEESREKKIKPPKLLNITGLQKEAFKRFGFKPEETLDIAQALYETHKCLSYPRTPSRVMGDNNAELFLEKFNLLKNESSISEFSDVSLITVNNKHIFNSSQLEDHHALIPLDKIPSSADEKEYKVYSIVLESFFTVCMPDYIYNEKSLKFHVSSYLFSSVIREAIQKGWKEIVKNENDDQDEEEVPPFDSSGCSISSLRVLELLTKPNKEFAIVTLLSFMEHPKSEGNDSGKLSGLGTPATRADIIKKLFASQYLREEKKSLFVTERGHFLLDSLSKNPHLKKMADVSCTTDWESSLAVDPKAFEKEIAEYVSLCVKGGADRQAFQQPSLGLCPLCKMPVIETKIAYSCSGYKDTKCPFAIFKTIAGAAVSAIDASLLLTGQKTKFKKCKTKECKPFEASFFLEGGKVKFIFKDKK
jgi:DNA topoisomerase-3